MKTTLLIFLLFAVALAEWRVGSSSNTIIPLVNGRNDYVKPVPEDDHVSPGTFVKAFDDGKISVGNGAPSAHWVRDYVNCTVAAISSNPSQTLIIVSCNVYMIFKNDWELYYQMVRNEVRDRGELKFIGHATHNHHMADTSGLNPNNSINDKWYQYMLRVMTRTTIEALRDMKPCTLHLSETKWAFGLGDARDPRIIDNNLQVLQAKSMDRVILTIVQWTNHPEVTLGFQPNVTRVDCENLGLPNCSAKDAYLSGDYVGILETHLKAHFLSNVVFLNGAIGIMQSPIPGVVWEPSEQYPITGDGFKMPEGATRIRTSFRKTFLIGRELAKAVIRTARTSMTVPVTPILYKSQEFFTRVTNIRFRIAMRVVRSGNRSQVGFSPREIFICSDHNNPTPETCRSDDFKNSMVYDFPVRLGEYIKTELLYVRFGGMKWITAPAEVPPELFIGLPVDFGIKYYQNPQYHAVGENYTLPGVGRSILKCGGNDSCWMIGLGQDELGYMVPISDIRFKCILPASVCKELSLTFADSMSGDSCKRIIEDPTWAMEFYKEKYPFMKQICTIGLLDRAQSHYEETNGCGWNLANDYMNALRRVVN
jgi:hypothetical protein